MEVLGSGTGCNHHQQHKQQELPDLVFLVKHAILCSGDGYDVYAVDTTDGDLSIKLLFNFKPSEPDNMRIVVCGSNLCVIGAGLDEKTNKFSRQFLMVDLTNWRNRDREDFTCLKGPEPQGGKPCPVAFAVDDRLYALAGTFYSTDRAKDDIPDPAFEVFDPYGDDPCWKPLSTPPFNDFYYNKKAYLTAHKVVGKTLYVTLEPNKMHGRDFYYYSYSVTNDKWERINVDESDTIRTNLTVYGNYKNWYGREDFDGNMMGFHVRGTSVLARDMKAKVDSRRMRKDHMAVCDLYDYSVPPKNYPYLVVHGLDHINDLGGKVGSTSGFVAHLAGNIFCVIYLFIEFADDDDEDNKCHIHACKFELHVRRREHKDSLRAKILGCADYFPKEIGGFKNFWDKMQNNKSCGASKEDDRELR